LVAQDQLIPEASLQVKPKPQALDSVSQNAAAAFPKAD
jgi:hypothetical protein